MADTPDARITGAEGLRVIDPLHQLRDASERATPGPWEFDCEPNPDGEYGSGPDPETGYDDFMILGAEGGKILGTENATHKLIEEESWSDEHGEGVDAWDQIGKANAAFAVAAVNFTRSILDGTFPDQAAVERAAEAMAEPLLKEFDAWRLDMPVPWDRVPAKDQETIRTLARAALTAALTAKGSADGE